MIYMDYAATTPMSDAAINVYTKVAKDYYGNPSSLHDIGLTATQILDKSREELAAFIGGEARGVYFTAGGSEANMLAVRSLIKANAHKGRHLITTVLEHSSLANVFKMLEAEGFEVTYLPVNQFGQLELDTLKKAIRPDTILASIHHANSEIGTIQDIGNIGKLLHAHHILFHSDCVQTFGKEKIDVKAAHIDSLSMSSHKIYGPKGVGACYISPDCAWKPVIENTSHENGFRPGTVNVPGIAAFLTAIEEMKTKLDTEKNRMTELRHYFLEKVKKLPIDIEGHPTSQLPHIIGLRLNGIQGQYTMLECNRYGIAISTGSACSAGKANPSKTMLATGKTNDQAKEFIRLSLGKSNTKQDLDEVIAIFERLL